MFVLGNTNGKIKGIGSYINNDMRLFLSDGDTMVISLETNTEDDFVRIVRDIDDGISEEFLKQVYNHFKNGGKE